MPRISDSRFSEVHLETEAAPDAVQLDADRPFRILLVGDFSGRSWRAGASRWFEPLGIDRDNFDEVLEGMNVRLDLHGIDLSFRELEDFHPDRIYQSAAIFRRLDELVDGGKPAAAATQSVTQAATQAAPTPAPAAGLLDQILAEHHEGRPVSARDADDLASFIQRATEGYVVPRADPTEQQREVRRQDVAAGLLRGILHHPHMQAIESAWRALFMLVRELETDGGLKLYVLDISLPELVRDMSAVHEELGKRGPWAVIAGNYSFGQSERDVRVLRRLADMARSLGAPFLGEGWLSKGEPSDAWRELRRTKEARWVGLAMPRVLLRLPYGKATGAIESFPFEEMPTSEHAAYLWGNPAFFCARLIGRSFLSHGWEPGGRLARRIDGLPMHVYREDGEAIAKPCAEILMTERDAENLLDAGFMPLVSIKNEAAVAVVRFQSIAEPCGPLAGFV